MQGSDYPRYTAFDNFAKARPTLLLTYEESLFLRSEAAVRGWAATTENAQTLYEDGVRAAIGRYRTPFVGVADALVEANTYLARPAINFRSTANNNAQSQRRLISTQKWLSYFGTNGMEAWTEARRTNVPTLVAPIVSALGSGQFVKRLPYPNSELQRNPNVATTGLAPGDVTTPVWWDAN